MSIPSGDEEHGRPVGRRRRHNADADTDGGGVDGRTGTGATAKGRTVPARTRVGRAATVGPSAGPTQGLIGPDREARVDHHHQRVHAGVDVVVTPRRRCMQVQLQCVDQVRRDECQRQGGDVE